MIQIDELKYRYSDSAVWALRDTSFSVGNGELIVLTGKSRSEEHTSELQSQWSSRMPSSA